MNSSRINSQLDYYTKKNLPMKLAAVRSEIHVMKDLDNPEQQSAEQIPRKTTPTAAKEIKDLAPNLVSSSILPPKKSVTIQEFPRTSDVSNLFNNNPSQTRPSEIGRPSNPLLGLSLFMQRPGTPVVASRDEENFKLLMNHSLMRMDNLRDFFITKPNEYKFENNFQGLNTSKLNYSGLLKQTEKPLPSAQMNPQISQFLIKRPDPLRVSGGLQEVAQADGLKSELILLFLEKVEILRLNEKLRVKIFDEKKDNDKSTNVLRLQNEKLTQEIETMKGEVDQLRTETQRVVELEEDNERLTELLEKTTEELSSARGEVYSLKTELDNNGSLNRNGRPSLTETGELAKLKREFTNKVKSLEQEKSDLKRRIKELEDNAVKEKQSISTTQQMQQGVIENQRTKINQQALENARLASDLKQQSSRKLDAPTASALQELLYKLLAIEQRDEIGRAFEDQSRLASLIRQASQSPMIALPNQQTPIVSQRRLVYQNEPKPTGQPLPSEVNSVEAYIARPQPYPIVVQQSPVSPGMVYSYQRVVPLNASGGVGTGPANPSAPSPVNANIIGSRIQPAQGMALVQNPRVFNAPVTYIVDIPSNKQIANILSDKSERENDGKDHERFSAQSNADPATVKIGPPQSDRFETMSIRSADNRPFVYAKQEPSFIRGQDKRGVSYDPSINDSQKVLEKSKASFRENMKNSQLGRRELQDPFEVGRGLDLKSELMRLKNKVFNLEAKARGPNNKLGDVSGITNNDVTSFSFTQRELSVKTAPRS